MNTTTATKAARLFVQHGTRPRNREEQTAYLRAYLLKSPACPREIVEACAEELAGLIAGEDCILIPVPDSMGDTRQNRWLANRIAHYADNAEVQDILTRSTPTESQCKRHRQRKAPLPPEALNITLKPHKPFALKRIYFVDNVTTSGGTLQACHNALGFGTGLVYAEAMKRK